MGEFDALMVQTVTYETFHSINSYGDPSYNTGTSVKAKIDLRIRKVITLEGKEAVSTCLIVLPSTISPDLYGRDRITLPAAYGSRQPVILAIEDARELDSNTIDHWEIST